MLDSEHIGDWGFKVYRVSGSVFGEFGERLCGDWGIAMILVSRARECVSMLDCQDRS